MSRSLEQWLAYQQGTPNLSIDLSLERVRAVAVRLGLLEKRCPVVIIAGTNGKGSTATLLAALLQSCGQSVGLFTSPHLVRYNERVQVNGVQVSDEALLAAFERIEAARAGVTLTFFEYNTLAALEVFRRAAVGVMVLEVGLGGRLDAANIIDADVAVVCSIGLDHREWLGATLDQIGAEKAGIFRRAQKVVLGSTAMPDSVWRAARELDRTAQRRQPRLQGACIQTAWFIFDAGEQPMIDQRIECAGDRRRVLVGQHAGDCDAAALARPGG